MNNRTVRKAFLDTCIINFLADHSASIINDTQPSPELDPEDFKDLVALKRLIRVDQARVLQFAVSPYTYAEVLSTRDEQRRGVLAALFVPIWEAWTAALARDERQPTLPTVERFKSQMLMLLDLFTALPQMADRVLFIDSLLYGSHYFCTRDRKTILRFRDRADAFISVLSQHVEVASIPLIPIEVVSPAELHNELLREGLL